MGATLASSSKGEIASAIDKAPKTAIQREILQE